MGVSTNAMLVFGFPVGDEDEAPEWLEFTDEVEDFDAWLAMKAGLTREENTYEARRKIAAACPADLFTHCSSDYPMYILGVRSAEFRAIRGDPTDIDPEELDLDGATVGLFKKWCEANDIPYQEPKWWLCSYWG